VRGTPQDPAKRVAISMKGTFSEGGGGGSRRGRRHDGLPPPEGSPARVFQMCSFPMHLPKCLLHVISMAATLSQNEAVWKSERGYMQTKTSEGLHMNQSINPPPERFIGSIANSMQSCAPSNGANEYGGGQVDDSTSEVDMEYDQICTSILKFDDVRFAHMVVNATNVIDLRWGYSRSCRAFWHRVVDHFIPAAPLMLQAIDEHKQICLGDIRHPPCWEAGYRFFLMAAGLPAHMISMCQNAAINNSNAQTNHAVEEKIIDLSARSTNGASTTRTRIDAFDFIVDRAVGVHCTAEQELNKGKHIVWISRHNSRKMKPEVEENVKRELSQIGNLHVYDGKDDLGKTLCKFATADVVVGYHGAGMVNALFSRKARVLLYELTTFIGFGNENQRVDKIWRANSPYLHTLNPRIGYRIHVMPLEDIFASNQGQANCCKCTGKCLYDPNHYIKGLPFASFEPCHVEIAK